MLAVGKLLLRCRLLGGAERFGTHGGRRGAGHTMAAACLQLVTFLLSSLILLRYDNYITLFVWLFSGRIISCIPIR